jgi:hypothetical protein
MGGTLSFGNSGAHQGKGFPQRVDLLPWFTQHGPSNALPGRAHGPKLTAMIPKSFHIRDGRRLVHHDTDPDLAKIVPFGRYGGGEWTGHPIGLVIALGLLFMGLVGIPQFRWFFVGALMLGGLWGLLLWVYHR